MYKLDILIYHIENISNLKRSSQLYNENNSYDFEYSNYIIYIFHSYVACNIE